MFKKVLALTVCAVLVFTLAGCKFFGKDDTSSVEYIDITSSEEEPVVEKYAINPLTGVKNLELDKADLRPVAVMVNNISTAQGVQTGLNDADIVYETEVEGGVTRLLAIYKDFGAVGQIGSVRSARYPYVDLALGHDAVYIHCGQDPTYCRPHLRAIDDISVDTGTKGAKRIKNGLASEHTLYVFGNELWDTISSKFNSKTASAPWQSFADEEETVSLTGGGADTVEIPFPVLKTVFKYDAVTGLYKRFSMGNEMKDYVTRESITVKNIFILFTSITNYPDGKHRRVALEGGNGYYITNGAYTPVKWQKGGEKSPIKITTEAGGELKVSAGRSWVCIVNTSTCKPVMTSAQPADTTTYSI
ncbi:MAG: DUF3048 domain-containing protein [Clostridia bacterium]|nr:DUF3048 domain-containing protein [Clostridia bacterium]